MTRRTPWTAENTSTASATTQPQVQATAAPLQELPPQPAIDPPSPDAAQATEHARVTQAYDPPKVEEDSEEVLHLQHPDPETKARVEAEERRQEAKLPQSDKPGPSFPPRPAQDDDSDDEDDNGADLLDTLGDFLTGGSPSHSRQPPNPLGFLDFLGEALVAPFLGDQHRHDEASESVSTTRDRPAQPAAEERPQGNFHMSSSDIKLEGGRNLVARCKNITGEWTASRFDLNSCLMNDNGHFRWSTEGGFSHTARSIKVESGGEVLSAQLQTAKGHWRSARVRLSDVITNGNGQLNAIPQHQWR